MAQDDNYKEGVDYVMVDKGGYKTRHFLTKAEKAAKNAPAPAPKAAAPKAAKPKFSVSMAEKAINKAATKGQPMDSSPRPKPRPVDKTPTPVNVAKPGDITTSKLNAGAGGARPEGKAAGMPQNRAIKNYTDQLKSGKLSASEARSARTALSGLQDDLDKLKANLPAYKNGGVVKMKEGSAKDTREDKVKAKKAGMSMTKWESSAADKKHDAPKKMAGGGVVKKAFGGPMGSASGRPMMGSAPRPMPTKVFPARPVIKGQMDDTPRPMMGSAPRPTSASGTAIAKPSTPTTTSTPVSDPSRMKRGGTVKSVGAAKRGAGVEKKATGGTMRGAGCATRGKGFAGTF